MTTRGREVLSFLGITAVWSLFLLALLGAAVIGNQ